MKRATLALSALCAVAYLGISPKADAACLSCEPNPIAQSGASTSFSGIKITWGGTFIGEHPASTSLLVPQNEALKAVPEPSSAPLNILTIGTFLSAGVLLKRKSPV